jgi:hypothetical protein
MDANQKQDLLFTQLVLMFHTLTMQQLGKIKNPMTDKIERDLQGAQSSIDLLDMLKEKTKGNLSPETDRFLTSSLKELRLNYVDEASKPVEQTAERPKAEEGKQTA